MVLKFEKIWNELTSGMQPNVSIKWWSDLIERYSSDTGRSYHNLNHLLEKFDHFEAVRASLKNPDAVAFAIFFHYFEYDPKSDCEAKNIEHFTRFATEADIPKESPLFTEVVSLLQVSATHSTEEHKTTGSYGNDDCHYFLDIDMAVLGSNPECYADYTRQVQQEYDFLPGSMYKDLRLKVLQNFLQIPNIFASKEFREKYESQARLNIQQEVESLRI